MPEDIMNGGGYVVGGYSSSPYEQQPSDSSSSAKIFIGGLSPSVTSESLISHFSAYGEVVDATIMNDKITGRPRGFGFVTFRLAEAVDALMQENHVLDGKQVECKRAVPMGYLDKTPGMVGRVPAGSSQTSGGGGYGGPQSVQGGSGGGVGIHARYNPEKIFVGGLPISCDDAKLREYFSKYGVIVDAVVMIDRELHRHRGFGYVLFQDAASVDATVNEHESHQIDGKWVDVKRCVVQENASWPPQSGPMRKGFGKGIITPPMAGSATMPGYGMARPSTGGYGGADYGTSSYYGANTAAATAAAYGNGGYGRGMGKPSAAPAGYGMGGYMPNAYGAPQPSYGYAPADPYASSGYGAAAPSPYGAMPGYGSSGYGGYGASTAGYGQAPPAASAYGTYGQIPTAGGQSGVPPTSAGAANPNDLYAASRRTGYRTSPY